MRGNLRNTNGTGSPKRVRSGLVVILTLLVVVGMTGGASGLAATQADADADDLEALQVTDDCATDGGEITVANSNDVAVNVTFNESAEGATGTDGAANAFEQDDAGNATYELAIALDCDDGNETGADERANVTETVAADDEVTFSGLADGTYVLTAEHDGQQVPLEHVTGDGVHDGAHAEESNETDAEPTHEDGEKDHAVEERDEKDHEDHDAEQRDKKEHKDHEDHEDDKPSAEKDHEKDRTAEVEKTDDEPKADENETEPSAEKRDKQHEQEPANETDEERNETDEGPVEKTDDSDHDDRDEKDRDHEQKEHEKDEKDREDDKDHTDERKDKDEKHDKHDHEHEKDHKDEKDHEHDKDEKKHKHDHDEKDEKDHEHDHDKKVHEHEKGEKEKSGSDGAETTESEQLLDVDAMQDEIRDEVETQQSEVFDD